MSEAIEAVSEAFEGLKAFLGGIDDARAESGVVEDLPTPSSHESILSIIDIGNSIFESRAEVGPDVDVFAHFSAVRDSKLPEGQAKSVAMRGTIHHVLSHTGKRDDMAKSYDKWLANLLSTKTDDELQALLPSIAEKREQTVDGVVLRQHLFKFSEALRTRFFPEENYRGIPRTVPKTALGSSPRGAFRTLAKRIFGQSIKKECAEYNLYTMPTRYRMPAAHCPYQYVIPEGGDGVHLHPHLRDLFKEKADHFDMFLGKLAYDGIDEDLHNKHSTEPNDLRYENIYNSGRNLHWFSRGGFHTVGDLNELDKYKINPAFEMQDTDELTFVTDTQRPPSRLAPIDGCLERVEEEPADDSSAYTWKPYQDYLRKFAEFNKSPTAHELESMNYREYFGRVSASHDVIRSWGDSNGAKITANQKQFYEILFAENLNPRDNDAYTALMLTSVSGKFTPLPTHTSDDSPSFSTMRGTTPLSNSIWSTHGKKALGNERKDVYHSFGFFEEGEGSKSLVDMNAFQGMFEQGKLGQAAAFLTRISTPEEARFSHSFLDLYQYKKWMCELLYGRGNSGARQAYELSTMPPLFEIANTLHSIFERDLLKAGDTITSLKAVRDGTGRKTLALQRMEWYKCSRFLKVARVLAGSDLDKLFKKRVKSISEILQISSLHDAPLPYRGVGAAPSVPYRGNAPTPHGPAASHIFSGEIVSELLPCPRTWITMNNPTTPQEGGYSKAVYLVGGEPPIKTREEEAYLKKKAPFYNSVRCRDGQMFFPMMDLAALGMARGRYVNQSQNVRIEPQRASYDYDQLHHWIRIMLNTFTYSRDKGRNSERLFDRVMRSEPNVAMPPSHLGEVPDAVWSELWPNLPATHELRGKIGKLRRTYIMWAMIPNNLCPTPDKTSNIASVWCPVQYETHLEILKRAELTGEEGFPLSAHKLLCGEVLGSVYHMSYHNSIGREDPLARTAASRRPFADGNPKHRPHVHCKGVPVLMDFVPHRVVYGDASCEQEQARLLGERFGPYTQPLNMLVGTLNDEKGLLQNMFAPRLLGDDMKAPHSKHFYVSSFMAYARVHAIVGLLARSSGTSSGYDSEMLVKSLYQLMARSHLCAGEKGDDVPCLMGVACDSKEPAFVCSTLDGVHNLLLKKDLLNGGSKNIPNRESLRVAAQHASRLSGVKQAERELEANAMRNSSSSQDEFYKAHIRVLSSQISFLQSALMNQLASKAGKSKLPQLSRMSYQGRAEDDEFETLNPSKAAVLIAALSPIDVDKSISTEKLIDRLADACEATSRLKKSKIELGEWIDAIASSSTHAHKPVRLLKEVRKERTPNNHEKTSSEGHKLNKLKHELTKMAKDKGVEWRQAIHIIAKDHGLTDSQTDKLAGMMTGR